MGRRNSNSDHIVMLPFMAHGHLIPFLSLAQKIQRRRPDITITIATTPLNTQYLRSSLAGSNNNSNNIRLHDLPLSSEEYGLPPGAENTENLPLDMMINLFLSSTTLESPVNDLIVKITAEDGGRPPLCVISDVFFGWANDVAAANKTPNFTFTTGGAYGTLAYTSIWLNRPHRRADGQEQEEEEYFDVPGFGDGRRFHITQLHKFLRKADGTDSWSKFFQIQLPKSLESHGWLCNSVEEIEPLGFELLRKYTNRQIYGIGPLLPNEFLLGSSSSSRATTKTHGVSPEKCSEWLQLHEPGSVLYISFGSQNSINPSQMMELAIGLEQSSVSAFVWVIRPPIGFDRKSEFRPEWLPEGFEERMKESKRGLLIRNWAPQLEILSHESVGGFLSHCGWNSVLESLSQGVPIIGWPLAAEQAFNSKMLVEEMGVAVELARGAVVDLDREEVKRVVEIVMVNGEEMKRRALMVSEELKASVRDDDEQGKKKKKAHYRSTSLNLDIVSMGGGDGHIVMLPVTAHGHLIPFLALARQILRRRPSFTITIATTPLNTRHLRTSLDPSADANILLADLPFNAADHGLPPDAENAANLTAEMRLLLYNASAALQSPVRDLLAEIAPPSCIISDVFFGWATEVAAEFGIKNFTFSTCGAYGSLGYMSVWMNLPHRRAVEAGGGEEEEFEVPGFPEGYRFQLNQLHKIYKDADGRDGWSKFFRKQIAGSMNSGGWLCNSVEEVEPLGLELLRKFVKRRIWAIGPLLPPEICGQSTTKSR
ncbi:Crocetin glucosyltransferase 3 [Linum grandiflorum]